MKRSWHVVQAVLTAFSLLGTACFLDNNEDEARPRRQGQSCEWTEQCVPGLICGGESRQSVCQTPPGLGGICPAGSSGGCAGDLVCSQGQCVEPHSKVEGDRCSYNVDCIDGLVCNWGSYTCEPTALVGEPCGHPNDCQQGLVCPDFTVIGERTCQCAESCAPGLICGAHGCMKPGSIASGGRCVHNNECSGGSVCVWAETPHVCGPARKLGEACGHPTDCAAGLTCDDKQEVCAPACEANEDCADGTWCDADLFSSKPGLCRPQVDAGEPCTVFPGGDAMCKGPLSCVARCISSSKTLDGICGTFVPEGGACVACAVPDKDGDKELLGALYSDAGCEPGLVCEGGVCAKPAPNP